MTMAAHKRKRSGWKFSRVASAVLVLVGVSLLYVGWHEAPSGPTIPGPIGVTNLVRKAPVTTTSTPSRSTLSSYHSCRALRATKCQSLSSSLLYQRAGTLPAVLTSDLVSRYLLHNVSSTSPSAPTKFASFAKIARSRPVHLFIPRLRMSVAVSELGLNHNGTVRVPTNVNVPGWYKLGPAPGQKGSAVILGHVDSYKGPAVFYHLSQLRPGNVIVVTLADGRKLTFTVMGLRMFSKDHFPSRLVYGRRWYSALQLVTCGGTFDYQTGHYESNLVVFTHLTSSTGARRA